MARSRKQRKKSTGYQTLENRRLLAGDSTFFLSPETGTLHISAAENTDVSAQFANETSVSLDETTGELVVTEVGSGEHRFSTDGLTRISYRGTFRDDLFANNTDIDTRVVGLGGNDNITTGGGDDRVIGGNGDDIIRTGNGDDYVAGNQGNDQILESGDQGRDRFFGGPGNDVIDSGVGVDFVSGNGGDDIIRLGAGNDVSFGGEGNDEIFAGAGRDFVYGGNGDDLINGEAGNDRILGQDGDDVIFGGVNEDSLVGGEGADMIFGEAGNDSVVGGSGDDTLDGGTGRDRIVAAVATPTNDSFGSDTIQAGNDTDADVLISHPLDTIFGGQGDVLVNTNRLRLNQQARFLNLNAATPGWNVTDSGLQFRTIVPGTGASAATADQVRLNYEYSFTDGTVIESDDNALVDLSEIITGWAEGIRMLREGGTVELAVPASLAYGDSGTEGVPGGSTLRFVVSLIEVV